MDIMTVQKNKLFLDFFLFCLLQYIHKERQLFGGELADCLKVFSIRYIITNLQADIRGCQQVGLINKNTGKGQ